MLIQMPTFASNPARVITASKYTELLNTTNLKHSNLEYEVKQQYPLYTRTIHNLYSIQML